MIKVVKAKANDDYTLDLLFSDGSAKSFDAKPYLDFPVFRPLKDLDQFRNFRVVFGTVQWGDEQDISPETLYLESVETGETAGV